MDSPITRLHPAKKITLLVDAKVVPAAGKTILAGIQNRAEGFYTPLLLFCIDSDKYDLSQGVLLNDQILPDLLFPPQAGA